ncbi:MAG: tetratricopeptide repeat protein [Acidobacteria bacterium]|nr:tetratricopeptide repeat protein [Acidobacteriota bacterium]
MKLPDVSLLKTLTQGPEARALERAKALTSEGKLDKAIATLEGALDKQPDSEALLLEQSRCLLAASRDADASECLKRILRRNPRRIDVVLEFIEEVKMKFSAVGTYYDAVAEHYIRVDDYPKALDALERIAPEELRVYHGRHLAKWDAVEKNAPTTKLTKTSLHSAYFVALALERMGDGTKAAQAYRRILEKNAEEADRIAHRLESILARDYQNLPLRLTLVDLLLKAGKFPESLKHLEHSLEADAAGSAAHVSLRLELIAKKLPNNPDVLWLLARSRQAEAKYPEMLLAFALLSGLGARRNEIIALLEELTPRMDDFPALRLALADFYVAAGKPVLAVEAILLASEKVGDEVAYKALEKVTRAHPNHSRAYLLLGDLDFKANRGAAGVERYEKALALSPEDGPILVPKLMSTLESGASVAAIAGALAKIFLREGDRAKAALFLRYRLLKDPEGAPEVEELATEALVAEPAHPGLCLVLGDALITSGRCLEAVGVLGRVLSTGSTCAPEALRLLSRASRSSDEAARSAIPVYRVAASSGLLPAASQFGLGEAALLSGSLAEAVRAFQEVAAAAPERMSEVREIFETLLAKHPEMVEVRYVLTGLSLDQRDFKAASNELKKIRTLNPDLLAPILAKFREALKATPADIEVRLGLSSALLLSGQLEEVQTLASETLRLKDDPTTAPLQLDLGDVALQKLDTTGAVKRYYNAFRKNPRLAPDAAARLEHLLNLHPNLPLASLALGKVLPDTGRVEDAVARLLEAFRNDNRISEGVLTELDRIRVSFPVSPQAAQARVEILCALGKDAAATEAIQAILGNNPDSARSLLPRLEEILSRSPRLAPALLALAGAQRALNETALAAEACRSAYRADPGCASQVIKLCSEMIASEPKAAGPYLTMAEIYLADGEVAAAAEKLAQAASRTEGSHDEELALLEAIIAKDSGTARIAFLAGEILARAGRHGAAAHAYRKALEREAGLLDPILKGLNALVEKEPKLGEARLVRAQALSLRQEFDAAIEDLEATVRSAPSLLSEVVVEAQRIHQRRPGGYRLVSLLSDALLASERLQEAAELLEGALKRSSEPGERLVFLVRLWRARLGRGEAGAARDALREAEGLASDRNHLMARVHECILAHLRREVSALRERALGDGARPSDLKRLAEALLDLGESGEAISLTAAGSGALQASDLLRIHSEAAAQESDYFRAAEILKPLGADRKLAFAAQRAGNYLLACQTLEQISAADPSPEIRAALQRVYHRLVLQELEPGRATLVGETILRFGQTT